MEVQDATPTENLKIYLLGQFSVYVCGRPLEEATIKGRKARSLLKLLALQPRAQIVRDRAMDVLWPDLDAEAAAAQLYKALHHLRKAFGTRSKNAAEWIVITADLVRLVPPGGVETDFRRFEEAAKSGLRTGEMLDLQRAVSEYVGDLLPTDFYAEWTAIPRRQCRQLYLDVLTELASQYELRGDLSEAAEMLRLALQQDAAYEAAHRGLMRIFGKRGQATRALRQYERCRQALRTELDIEPAEETLDVVNRVRTGRAEGARSHGSLASTIAVPRPPIVNRDEERELIELKIDSISEGAGCALIITGGIGIGKTRLTQEIAVRARRRGFRVFAGKAREGEGKAAYGPFIEIFDAVLRRYPDMQMLLPVELGTLVPSFSGDGEPVPHADKLAAQGYLFAQVHRFFARLAEDGPLVVIVDDLHAADEGSRAMFNYLLRHGQNLSVLFAAAARDDGGLDVYEAGRAIDVLELTPLSEAEHVQLLRQEVGDLDAAGADGIYSISEGNPLFALELLRARKENGASAVPTGARFTAKGPGGRSVPATLLRRVERQLKALSPSAHHLLFIAAVIGRHVPFELLSTVWSGAAFSSEETLYEPLEELIHEGLLAERGLDYAFRHALVREAVYASISEARRRALHALVAGHLVERVAERDQEPVEQIAHHFVRAGELRRGVHYLVKAGERAEAAYDHDDALLRYREALDVLEDLNDSAARRLRRDVLERVGDAYRACGRLEQSFDAYEQAVAVAEDLPLSSGDLVELHRKIALAAILKTDVDRAERHLKVAFDLGGEDPRVRARLLIVKALELWHRNQLDEAAQLAHEALERAESVDAAAEASQACEILAMTYLPLGRWEEGLEYEMRRQVYGWSPDVVVATDAHLCLWEYHVGGDQPFQQARSFMQRVARQASELGDLRCVAVCHYALGTMHLWRGESREAVQELEASMKLHQNVGSPAGMAYALARTGVLQTMQGATDLGWKAVQEGMAHAEHAAVRDHCLQRLYGVGIWNRLEADDLAEARRLVDESIELLDQSGACGACALELYPWLAYYYLRSGEIDRAQECGEAVEELASKTGNPVGEASAAMIQSSLLVADRQNDAAAQRRREAFALADGAVTESTHSPVVYYLDRMADQQERLMKTPLPRT